VNHAVVETALIEELELNADVVWQIRPGNGPVDRAALEATVVIEALVGAAPVERVLDGA
jgi:hypothetical protein